MLCQAIAGAVNMLQPQHSHVLVYNTSLLRLSYYTLQNPTVAAANKVHHGSHLLAHSPLFTIEESAIVAVLQPGQASNYEDAIAPLGGMTSAHSQDPKQIGQPYRKQATSSSASLPPLTMLCSPSERLELANLNSLSLPCNDERLLPQPNCLQTL